MDARDQLSRLVLPVVVFWGNSYRLPATVWKIQTLSSQNLARSVRKLRSFWSWKGETIDATTRLSSRVFLRTVDRCVMAVGTVLATLVVVRC